MGTTLLGTVPASAGTANVTIPVTEAEGDVVLRIASVNHPELTRDITVHITRQYQLQSNDGYSLQANDGYDLYGRME